MRQVIVQEYRLQSGQSETVKAANITQVAKLRNNQGFLRPVSKTTWLCSFFLLFAKLSQLSLPLEQRTGLYQNKAIGQYLNLALFGKKNALGITQASYFGTVMPKETVAYALTMVRYLSYPSFNSH